MVTFEAVVSWTGTLWVEDDDTLTVATGDGGTLIELPFTRCGYPWLPDE